MKLHCAATPAVMSQSGLNFRTQHDSAMTAVKLQPDDHDAHSASNAAMVSRRARSGSAGASPLMGTKLTWRLLDYFVGD